MDKEKEEKKGTKPIGLYIIIPILVLVSILTFISFYEPEIILGWYFDNDIRSQLLELHNSYLEEMPDRITTENVNDIIVNARFTFDNDELTDIRVKRAIIVFQELFPEHETDWTVKETDENTQLEFRWVIIKKGDL